MKKTWGDANKVHNGSSTRSSSTASADSLEECLGSYLDGCGRVLVAFSGGVDSSLLLTLAVERLGVDNVLAVTAVSPLLSPSEIINASEIAAHIGARHLLLPGGELDVDAIVANQSDRCLHCKRHKLALLTGLAEKQGCQWVLEGSNQSDTLEFRPGLSALKDYPMVRSPFMDCGLAKEDIRRMARTRGLPNWNLAPAACLASRIPYGTCLDETRLSSIARAEAGLRALGLEPVRVRHHGEIARIEAVPGQFNLLTGEPARRQIAALLKTCGFLYAVLDLEGYRTGSLDEGLNREK